MKPILNEVFADNGEHSHWELIDSDNGKIIWTESPLEALDSQPSQQPTDSLGVDEAAKGELNNWLLDCGYSKNDEGDLQNEDGDSPDLVLQYLLDFFKYGAQWQASKAEHMGDAVELKRLNLDNEIQQEAINRASRIMDEKDKEIRRLKDGLNFQIGERDRLLNIINDKSPF